MIRAYDKKYLNDAMLNLGEAFDFAANVCQVELDNFLSMMISTGIAFPFERGVPKYVSGMSGTELALEILQKSGVAVENPAARTEYSCSPILNRLDHDLFPMGHRTVVPEHPGVAFHAENPPALSDPSRSLRRSCH